MNVNFTNVDFLCFALPLIIHFGFSLSSSLKHYYYEFVFKVLTMTYFLLILGFVFLIKGADLLVDGASGIAKRFGVSDLVIGLTIVAFGTSAPELMVNILAVLRGAGDIAVGSIVGSNISNIFLILGVSAMITPLAVQRQTTWKEIPLNLLAAIVLFLVANDVLIDGAEESLLTRIDGLVMICFFIIFIYYTFHLARSEKNEVDKTHKRALWLSVGMTLVGIVALAFGGQWVIESSQSIAASLGLSEALIGLTAVALGTSLPELATSAVAAYKGNTDIAVGNVVGSNVFNIFWVLGISSVIRPIEFSPLINTDILIYIVATVLLFIFSFTGGHHKITRKEGFQFLIAYVAYIVFLFIRG